MSSRQNKVRSEKRDLHDIEKSKLPDKGFKIMVMSIVTQLELKGAEESRKAQE